MATYTKFNNFVDYLCKAAINLNTDTLSVYLSNATPDAELDSVKADLAEIATGNGYTGPEDTTNTYAEATGTVTVQGTKVVITASGGAIAQFRYIVLMDDTHASDALIAYWDYGSALDLANGESISILFNNIDGVGDIFTLS